MPHLGIAFFRLVAFGGAVLDERPDRRFNDRVVLPEGILHIALDQLVVLRLFQRRHHQRVAVAYVPGFVGLHRQEHRWQSIVAIAGGF